MEDNSNNFYITDNSNNSDNSDLKTTNEIYRDNTIYVIIYLNGIVTISTIILFIMTLFSKKLKNFKNLHKILLKIFLACINLYFIIFFNPFTNEKIYLTDNEKKEIFVASILILLNYIFR